MKIKFKKIIRESIFCDDFKNLERNNEIDFVGNKIVVIYGPNGTGKTSLARVLTHEKNAEYEIEVDNNLKTHKSLKFAHVISDQNDRNIIEGKTEDFILGDNIRKEYELKDKIEQGFKTIFESKLAVQCAVRAQTTHFPQ